MNLVKAGAEANQRGQGCRDQEMSKAHSTTMLGGPGSRLAQSSANANAEGRAGNH